MGDRGLAGASPTRISPTSWPVTAAIKEGRESAENRRAWSAVNSETLALGPSEHFGDDRPPLPVSQ